jgi:hypothetical protein
MADTLDPIDLLDTLPREIRPRLKLLFSYLDRLLFLDNAAELSVDRETLISLASDDDLTPPVLHDVMLVETSKYLGTRVKSVGQGQRISWREGERYGLPIHPPSQDELRSKGLDPAGSDEQLADVLRAIFPELPDFWIEADSAVLHDRIISNLLINQTVWSCLVRNLGFWAALNVIGTSIIALIMLGAGVPWQVVLKWLLIFTGVNTHLFHPPMYS